MIRLKAEQVRIPDVAFVSKKRFARQAPQPGAFWELGCVLAVEVISPSNTRREMERKLADYFAFSVATVWLVDMTTREVVVYTSPNMARRLSGDDALDGADVLPGFSVPVAQIFVQLDAAEA